MKLIYSLKKDNKEFRKKNKLILKTQQIFKSERHNVFTQIALSLSHDKMQ